MPFKTTVTRLPKFVRWRIAGPASLDNFTATLASIAHETASLGDSRLLVDLREVTGQLKFTEQLAVGEMVAAQLGHLRRVASVVPPQQLTRNSERVAVRKGVLLRVFADEEQAAHWLSETESETAPGHAGGS